MPLIRAYQASDWEAFIALEVETCLAAISSESDNEKVRARWPLFIKNTYGWDQGASSGPSVGQHSVWVLTAEDGGYAGHIWLTDQLDFFTQRNKLFVTTFAIVTKYRKRGFGKQLMEFALKSARARGIANVSLGVDARNTGAIKLYEALGFQTSRLSMECVASA
jgi:ribosomal protein S18 acetylase RimI-like enzyme